MESKLLPLLFLICIKLTLSQLSLTDINYIKKTLLSQQDETTGMFSKSLALTKKAVTVLKFLDEPVPNASKICRELNFELMNHVTNDIISLDEMLNCKLPITGEIKDDQLINVNLDVLYERVLLASKLKSSINWGLLFENVKAYITDINLFSNVNGSEISSIMSTSQGLKILSIILQQMNDNEAQKESLIREIKMVLINLSREFQEIRSDIGMFNEYGVPTCKVNSEIVEALLALAHIEDFSDILVKILNYSMNFKYEYTNIDNIYYFIKQLQNLSHIPLLFFDKKTIDYIEEKSITVKIINAFGKEIKDYSSVITYLVKEKPKEDDVPAKDEKKAAAAQFDLEDEVTDDKTLSQEGTSKKKKGQLVVKIPQGESSVSLDVSPWIKSPGKFTVEMSAAFTGSERNITQTVKTTLTSLSKLKINHLKMSVSATQDGADEKEVTVEYPKRSFRNIKATHNSVIKLKVKLTYGDNQPNKVEQIFLRLRHSELGKSYSAYVMEYKPSDDYYYIQFDMGDPMIMEAYNGLYELTLIVSDVGLDNPMIWNFGKIEVTFKKPLDPNTLAPSYKNPQKPKMEPFFPEEESPNKNLVLSIILCGAILFTFGGLLFHWKTIRANIDNFPRTQKSHFFFSVAFCIVLILSFYIMVLFWVKLNILQTLLAFIIIGLPGSFIVYKALSYITIEI